MAERGEQRTAQRLDKLVSDLLAGRHLKATPVDASEREAIRVAARLAGTRDGYPRMSPAFRRRLAGVLEKGEAPSWMNRRAALVAGMGLTVGAVGGALAQQLGGLANASHVARGPAGHAAGGATSTRGTFEPRPELARWISTGVAFVDLPEGVPVRVAGGAIGAFVVRHGNQVVGMSAYCTDLPCELVWLSDKRLLKCPCHNLTFDINGESLREGYPLPALPLVRARVRNGRVEVLGT
jgi:nitrite reductase/ring-hydroxylating ferredoxin subunit